MERNFGSSLFDSEGVLMRLLLAFSTDVAPRLPTRERLDTMVTVVDGWFGKIRSFANTTLGGVEKVMVRIAVPFDRVYRFAKNGLEKLEQPLSIVEGFLNLMFDRVRLLCCALVCVPCPNRSTTGTPAWLLQLGVLIEFMNNSDDASAVAAGIQEFAMDVVDKVRSLLEPKLQQGMAIIQEFVNDMLDQFREKIGGAITWVADKADGLLDNVQTWLESKVASKLAVIVDFLKKFKENVLENAATGVHIFQVIGGAIVDWAESIQDKNTLGELAVSVGKKLLEVADIVADGIEKVTEYVDTGIKLMNVTNLMDFLRDQVDDVVSMAEKGADTLIAKLKGMAAGFLQQGYDFVEGLIDKLEALVAKAVHKLSVYLAEKVVSMSGFFKDVASVLTSFRNAVGTAITFVDKRHWVAEQVELLKTANTTLNNAALTVEDFNENTLQPMLNITSLVSGYLDIYEGVRDDLVGMKDSLPPLLESYRLHGCVPGAMCIRDLVAQKLGEMVRGALSLKEGVMRVVQFVEWIMDPGDAFDMEKLFQPVLDFIDKGKDFAAGIIRVVGGDVRRRLGAPVHGRELTTELKNPDSPVQKVRVRVVCVALTKLTHATLPACAGAGGGHQFGRTR